MILLESTSICLAFFSGLNKLIQQLDKRSKKFLKNCKTKLRVMSSSPSALGPPEGAPEWTVAAGYVVDQDAQNTPSAQQMQTVGYGDAVDTLSFL